MKYIIVLILFSLLPVLSIAQIDTTDTEIKAVYDLWQNYIKTDHSNICALKEFWSKDTKKTFECLDVIDNGFSPSLYYFLDSTSLTNQVLTIYPLGENYCIKSAFYTFYEKTKENLYLMAVTKYIAKKEAGEYKLHNFLSWSTSDWKRQQMGILNYHYKEKFNDSNAQKANLFLQNFAEQFDLPPLDTIHYFVFDNCDELFQYQGYEYTLLDRGDLNQCGFYDEDNNIIYSGGGGEFYTHELAHVINKYFPDAHQWLLAGIAVYYGGHLGLSLNQCLEILENHLKTKPEIELNNFTETLSYNIDNQYNTSLIFGGFLIKIIHDDFGFSGVKEMLSSNTAKDESLYNFLIKKYQLKNSNDLGSFLEQKLRKINTPDKTEGLD